MTSNNDQVVQQLDYDDGECAICMGLHVYKSRIACGHFFCYECLSKWCIIKLECPMCKQDVNSFVTTDLPVSTLQNTSIGSSRFLSPLPDVLSTVLSIPIDAQSSVMNRFLTETEDFVSEIVGAHKQLVGGNGFTLNLIIWNGPYDEEELDRTLLQIAIRRQAERERRLSVQPI